jgi:pimeloyl-ACP methyl ester carboxylesterase
MGYKLEVEESTVLVDGSRLHFCRAGDGPALVLVHGLVGSSKNWEQNIAFLSRFRTVYALDLANMGTSEQVTGLNPGLEATADRLAASMAALGIDKADVGGHSHGGAIAMMLAARHPERVRRLVLFAPANPYCDLGKHLIRFYQTRAGIALARMLPKLPRMLHKTALSRMYGDPKRIHQGAIDGYTPCLNPGTIEHVLGIVRSWADDMKALRGVLRQIAGLPTLLIWGDRDRAVGLSSGQLLAKKLGAKLMVLPGVGHLPFAETPDICNEALVQWLRS